MESSYTIGWITLALINSALAIGMNRSRWAWLLISIVCGPIATFILVVIGKIEKVEIVT